jgi:hypothetical protein
MPKGSVTVLDRVRDLLIRLTPYAVCDACIASRLELSDRRYANTKTRELARVGGFPRRKGFCSMCEETREVTSAKAS